MDALDLLKRDHQNLRDLAQKAFASRTREDLLIGFRALNEELKSHFRVKAVLFYPSFHQERGFRPIILRSRQRQTRIQELSESIENSLRRPGEITTGVKSFLRDLQLELVSYCDQDESQYFGEAQRIMSRSERE